MTIQALTAEAIRIARELRRINDSKDAGYEIVEVTRDAELLAANMVCYAATVPVPPVIEQDHGGQDHGEGEG